MYGLEAIPEIAKYAPGAKIIVFATDDVDELRREALGLGAHSFLGKHNPERLLIELAKLLGSAEAERGD